MVTLENHYNQKDTYIFKYLGKVIIANGCKCFDINDFDKICIEFNISTEQKDQVLNCLSVVHESKIENIIHLIKKYPYSLKLIYGDDIFKDIINLYPLAIKFLSHQTHDLSLMAIQNDISLFEHIRAKSTDICLYAVSIDGNNLQYIKNQTQELCQLAIDQNQESKVFVHEKLKHLF